MRELLEQVVDTLTELPTSVIYLVIGVLCWAEAAFFLGFVTPGEIAVATGGILASLGEVSLAWLVVVVVAGTVAGNSTGYWLGRRWGLGVLQSPVLQRLFGGPIGIATAFMQTRGEWAIVLGRLTTPTRIVVPFLAGASRLPYPRFLAFDVPATLAWACAWCALGYFLGESWTRLEDVAGTAAVFVLALFVTGLIIKYITTRIARNQRRVRAAVRLFLTVTGTRRFALAMVPTFAWLGRRLHPGVARGLSLTLAFVILTGAVAGVGTVLAHTQAVRGLVLLDFPVLEWMVANRTDEAVDFARSALRLLHWPGVLVLALPAVAAVALVRIQSAIRLLTGLVGAGLGAYFLDMHVLEGVVPRAEFPSVPVAVATSLAVHLSAGVARRWGWGPAVSASGAGFFLICTVALGTLVAGWAAPSGIVLGFALGLCWSTLLELPATVWGTASPADSPSGKTEAPEVPGN